MKKLLYTAIIAITLFLINCQSINDSELCKKCKCNTADKIVSCNNVSLGSDISLPNFWTDSITNESYEFSKVAIKNAGIIHVMPFPPSPVKILDLSWNKIEIIEIGSFMFMQNLTEIDLSENDLTSDLLVPDVFKGIYAEDEYLPLKSMRSLNLANNQLHTLHQDIFEHIVNLQYLDLHGNPLRVIDTQTLIAISGLLHLRHLDLSYTNLKKLPDHMMHTPKNLSELYLNGNLFTSVPREQLADAKNLQFLSLDENPIINITSQNGFPILPKLKILSLCFLDNLTRIENGGMSGLWGLKELYISNNKFLTYIGNNSLVHNDSETGTETWPLITKLHLKNNKLSYLSHQFLARWDQLEEIELSGNAWSCDCENNWLVETVVKSIVDQNKSIHELWCAAPEEMQGQSLQGIYVKKDPMRCLDMYGAHPEKDAGILIGILIGLLTGIPLVLGILFCYKRQFFGYFSAGPAAFSRKFYNPAANEDEYYS